MLRQRLTQMRAGRWRRLKLRLGLLAVLAAAAALAGAAAANDQVPGLRWQVVGYIPARGRSAQALALDARSGVLYAGMQRGLYASADGGARWEPMLVNGATISVSVLALDTRQALLYVSDGAKIFRRDASAWQVFTLSVSNSPPAMRAQGQPAIWALAADEGRGLLYVGSRNDFLRSRDGGQTWEWLSALPAAGQTLALDEAQGEVYLSTPDSGELYGSKDGGRTWFRLARDQAGAPLAYLAGWGQWGVMGRWIDGSLFWAAEDMHGLWRLPRAMLDSQNCVVRPVSSSQAELLCAWGLRLMRSDLQAMPLPWLALRLWMWQVTDWVWGNAALVAASLAAGAGLLLASGLRRTYTGFSRPWGVPLWVAWFAPGRAARTAWPAALEAAWPAWEKQVRAELARFDEVIPADLVGIPGPLRSYALQRYAAQNAPLEWLDARPGRLRARAEAGTRRWRAATRGPSGSQPEQEAASGRAAAAIARAQASLLAEALGAEVGEPLVLDGAWVYWTTPAAAARLQLIVLETAWEETLAALGDRLRKDPGVLGLLMLLQDRASETELRQAAAVLAPVRNCVALSQDDVWRLLLARSPRQVLAELISAAGNEARVAA